MRQRLLRLLQAPWFIVLAALLFRLAFLAYKISVVPREALATLPFQNEVGNVATALASGHGFCCLFRQPTGPTAWLSPVYPLLIAAIFKIFGTFTFRAFCASVFLNGLSSALACIPLFYAAHRIAGKSTAALTTWLWAVSPIAIILPYAWIWDASLSALFATTILWATLRLAAVNAHLSSKQDAAFFASSAPKARHKLAQQTVEPWRGDTPLPSLLAFALYGLLWGISLLTNPALGALLPFFLLWLFLSTSNFDHSSSTSSHPEAIRQGSPQDLNRTSSSQPIRPLLTLVVLVLVCLPWTLRNYHDFHRFIPLRSNFPYELWSGNNELFDPESRSLNRITRYEQTRLYAHLGETAFLDEKWSAAKNFIRTHPALYARLCGQRAIATWFGTDSPFDDFLHADSVLARLLLLWNALSFLTMLIGLVRLWLSIGSRRGPAPFTLSAEGLDPMSAQSTDLASGKGSPMSLARHPFFFPVALFPVIFPITFYLAHTSLRHRHPCDPAIMLLAAIAIFGVRTPPRANDSRASTHASAVT